MVPLHPPGPAPSDLLRSHVDTLQNLTMADLFSPLRVGSLELPNRIWMAPLTRCRAEEDHVPGALIAEHYAQRASAGLIVSEATMVMEGHSAFLA